MQLANPRTEHPAHRGMRSTLIGIGINGLLVLIKATAGILGSTYALVADAIESGADVVTSLIVWFGLRYSAQPADEDHPYGHGKAEPLATLVVALALFGAAFGIAVQSIREIRTPHHSPASFTLAVLVLVIFVKETLFRWVFRVGDEVESSAVKGDAWHHRSDALTSAAAFVGISIGLIGGKGWETADDWAALLASGLIAFNGYRLLRPALGELTDTKPDGSIEAEAREVAVMVTGVAGLHRCYVRKMGFEYYVDLDVIVDRELPVHEAHSIAHQVQDAIRTANPRVARVFVHIEPSRPTVLRVR